MAGVLIPGRGKIFLFSTASIPALGPTQLPVQWVPGAVSQGVMWLEHEADHSLPSSAGMKNGGAIPPLSHLSSLHCAQLIKHRDNFTFTAISVHVNVNRERSCVSL
jgi:hypothetical protein